MNQDKQAKTKQLLMNWKLTNVPFRCCSQFSSLGSNCKKVAPATSAPHWAQLYLVPSEQLVPTRTQRDSIRKRERRRERSIHKHLEMQHPKHIICWWVTSHASLFSTESKTLRFPTFTLNMSDREYLIVQICVLITVQF